MKRRIMGREMLIKGMRKDGTTFPAEVSLSGVETPDGKLAVAFVSDITEREQLAEVARTRALQVRALAARILSTQEEERRRVSRELHDQICQQLASLVLEIDALIDRVNLTGGAREWLRTVRMRVVSASEEVRHIAYELHPSMLDDLGLGASLKALAKEFTARTGIRVSFSSSGGSWKIPREQGSCIYRVSQESLQNVARHSGARHVTVKLSRVRKAVRLSVHDDGHGFEMEAARGAGSLGLVGMEERVRLVKGKFSVHTGSGNGTLITVEIPLEPNNEQSTTTSR
jgi:signal transduction histidine kinase